MPVRTTRSTRGDTFTGAGSFTDPGADTWTGTVDYGDGSGVQPLALNPDKSFALSHSYADDGTYTVTVTVTDDDGGVGSDTLVVTVNNVPPSVDAGPDDTIDEGDTFTGAGSFTDPGADTWTGTVDYGDGSGVQPLALNPDKSFALSHPFATDGVYTVTVTVADDDGGVGSDTLVVTVNAVTEPEQTIFNLAARAKPGKINVTWAPVIGAAEYNVYRSNRQGGPYTLIAGGHQSNFAVYADGGLIGGQRYCYVVTSVTNGVESLQSNEACATPPVERGCTNCHVSSDR